MTSFLQARYHRQRPPALWWLRRRSYTLFMLRELSSAFVAWFVVYLLLLVRAVASGPTAYQQFLALSARPWMVALNLVALAFIAYHAITFVNLTPQAAVVRLRGRRLPARLVAGSVYLAWLVVSAVLAWLVVAW